MEADWEVELGGEAPVIEALWPGFVDLRLHPEQAWQLTEAAQLPTLAEALAKLNAAPSPVWTSKCDLWPVLDSGAFDPDELDAPHGSGAHAIGCYIDILPTSGPQWGQPAEAVCKHLCGLLRAFPLRCCRVDLVIRRAFIAAGPMNLGITAYLTACGSSPAAAEQTLGAALGAFAGVLCGQSTLE
jgi:hypothetical protein